MAIKRGNGRRGIPTLSLFSGAGGLDIGFAQAGFDIVACVEIDKSYCQTLSSNVGRGHIFDGHEVVHNEDIAKFDTRPYKGSGIRCIIGGPPCQTFSAAGRRSGGVIGTMDVRGKLFLEYCRILDELQPEVFVFENVYGLPGANGGGPWREMCKAFGERGYDLQATVVDAADYGVPQHRERLVLVGSRVGQFEFPLPTHGPDSSGSTPLVSTENAIADLQDPNEPYHDDLGGLYGHLLSLVPEGLNYSYFTAEMGHPEPVFAWRSKFHDLLYKVDRGAPCRTLKAQPGKFTGPFHWKNRHFTIAELKRLQTFPDDYEIVGTFGKVLEQIGNSVPPQLANVIAVSVREQLLERTDKLTFTKRPAGFASTFRQRQRLRNATFHEKARAAIASQYGVSGKTVSSPAKRSANRYVLRPNNLFDRTHRASGGSSKSAREYQVRVSDSNGHIEVEFARKEKSSRAVSMIEMSGLRKYLPDYDTLALQGEVSDLTDVFHAWGAIEKALTVRSRFFTLIDIYGHYANRGDTVNVKSYWNLNVSQTLSRALNLFGDTESCGEFLASRAVQDSLGTSEGGLAEVVQQLRAVRFDVRTHTTHPIISKGQLLCTYPFPLLSPRALVESRVQLGNGNSNPPIDLAEAV